MVIRTYFDRNNTIIYNSNINTGQNPVAELFYGGRDADNRYTRFLFYFDETTLKDFYSGGTYTDLSKLKHRLKMTNTGSFDKELMGTQTCDGKDRACSFDLILFPINQEWDEGVGYDYNSSQIFLGDGNTSTSTCPSNWVDAQSLTPWSGGGGTYTGTTTAITKTIHFEHGNENIDIDISDIVNGYLTGDTNNGLGVAFSRAFEVTETSTYKYVGFFTRHTQTFYEPYVETIYDCHIADDRANFYLDKENKLYLYSNIGGNPTNLDSIPSVDILDNDGNLFTSIPSSGVTHVTKGVYCVEVMIPSSASTDCYIFNDVWKGIMINGISRPDIELDFPLLDSNDYYNIGSNDTTPKKYAFNVSGINRDERIKRGDIRRVTVTARIPYTTNQSEVIDDLQYRLYVKEGRNELTVIDFQDVERGYNNNFFLLHTESLIPNTYYLDVKVTSHNEVTTIKDTLSFDIVSQSELRISQ